MKLIRVVNSDDKLTFDGDIQGNFTLEPNAEVALLNANWTNKVLEIDLKNTNLSEVRLEMNNATGDNTYTFNLEPALYTTETASLDNLLVNLENQLNKVMTYTAGNEKALGLKWLADFNETKNQINIFTNQQSLVDPVVVIEDTPDDAQRQYIADGIQDINGDNMLYTSDSSGPAAIYSRSFEFPRSIDASNLFEEKPSAMCAVWQCSLNVLEVGALGGIIGVMENPTLDRSNVANYEFGIQWTDNVTDYKYIKNGVIFISTITPNVTPDDLDNDFFQIRFDNNKIEVVIYNNNKVPKEQVLVSQEYTTSVLYPSLWLRDNKTVIKNLSNTPAITDLGETVDVIDKILETNFDVIEGYEQAINWRLVFSQQLSEFLGFNDNEINVDTIDFFWGADKVTRYSGSDAYIVELNNLQLESYDTQEQQRKSILSVITNENGNVQDFRHESNNLIFISINNNFPISLRNINLKVYDDNYNNITTTGKANLTLLFK